MDEHKRNPVDLVYASHKNGWIYGTAGELVKLSALKRAYTLTENASDREHVISFLKNQRSSQKQKSSQVTKKRFVPIFFYR
ncbi:MAG: hypothetical protein IPJ32_02050 [Sphingobacteriaceae bacterium]|nr:hypothetical protein [Sphingobacteriaceae bacterium]